MRPSADWGFSPDYWFYDKLEIYAYTWSLKKILYTVYPFGDIFVEADVFGKIFVDGINHCFVFILCDINGMYFSIIIVASWFSPSKKQLSLKKQKQKKHPTDAHCYAPISADARCYASADACCYA